MVEKNKSISTIATSFADLKDPRVVGRSAHRLIDILVIGICTVICGGDDYPAMEEFGKAKEEWFRTFLELPAGIPSHDTFWRLFSALDPEQFQACFLAWMNAISKTASGEIIALDGKQLRRSHDKSDDKAAIHMVSAWATTNRLVLGQVKVNEKSNEITAIPELLRRLDISGCLITIDAMGCQVNIAELIIEQGGDYLFSLKGNQSNLHEDVVLLFEDLEDLRTWKRVAIAPTAMTMPKRLTRDMDASKFDTVGRFQTHRLSAVCEAPTAFATCKQWSESEPNAISATNIRSRTATSSAVQHPVPQKPSGPLEPIGRSRILCTGSSTLLSEKTNLASAKAMALKTSPFCVTSLSMHSRRRQQPSLVSRTSGSRQVGMNAIYQRSLAICQFDAMALG